MTRGDYSVRLGKWGKPCDCEEFDDVAMTSYT